MEVTAQFFYLAQSQYTDTRPTSLSTDPIRPGAWLGSQRSTCTNFLSHWYDSAWKKIQGASRNRTLVCGHLNHKVNKAVDDEGNDDDDDGNSKNEDDDDYDEEYNNDVDDIERRNSIILLNFFGQIRVALDLICTNRLCTTRQTKKKKTKQTKPTKQTEKSNVSKQVVPRALLMK